MAQARASKAFFTAKLMRVINDEEIESVFVKVAEFEKFSKKVIHAASFEFAYLWFMRHKAQKYGL